MSSLRVNACVVCVCAYCVPLQKRSHLRENASEAANRPDLLPPFPKAKRAGSHVWTESVDLAHSNRIAVTLYAALMCSTSHKTTRAARDATQHRLMSDKGVPLLLQTMRRLRFKGPGSEVWWDLCAPWTFKLCCPR